jgi:hypothetical protein
MWVGGERQVPAALSPEKTFNSYCGASWVWVSSSLDGIGEDKISFRHQFSIFGPFNQ